MHIYSLLGFFFFKYYRPRKIQHLSKDIEQIFIGEEAEHTVKYEIRTKPKLFRSYLSKCDTVELGVWNAKKNEVIGSSFLEDLIYLVYETQFFTNSVVNECGDQIGEITCRFVVNEIGATTKNVDINGNMKINPKEKLTNYDLKLNLNLTDLYSPKEEIFNIDETDRPNKKTEWTSTSLKHIGSAGCNIQNRKSSDTNYNALKAHHSEVKVQNSLIPKEEHKTKHLFSRTGPVSKPQHQQCIFTNIEDDSKKIESKPSKVLIVKQITKNDLPAVQRKLIAVDKKQEKSKSLGVKVSPRPVNKFKPDTVNSGKEGIQKVNMRKTIRYVKKDKAGTDIVKKGPKHNKMYNNILKTVLKPTGNIKSFVKVSSEISKLNEMYLNVPKDNNHSDLEKVPVRDKLNDDCLKQPSSAEENEQEKAISSKKQSKSSFSMENEGIETNKNDAHFGNSISTEAKERINIDNKLFFDLSDPVEKVYYETFFVKSERICNNEFEIAELLNQPENKYVLEESSQNRLSGNIIKQNCDLVKDNFVVKDVAVTNKYDFHDPNKILKENCSSEDSNRNSTGASIPPNMKQCSLKSDINSQKEPDSQELDSKPITCEEYKSECYRCKYYKKLRELDQIIDTLRHFESKFKEDMALSRVNGSANPEELDKSTHIHKLMDESDQGDCLVESIVNESDFSKDDSDFIEFTHYLTKR